MTTYTCRHCGMSFEEFSDRNLHEEYDHTEITFESRRLELADSMIGFDGLIDAIQGMLVGYSIAVGEIWDTPDNETTRQMTYGMLDTLNSMVGSWGLEK